MTGRMHANRGFTLIELLVVISIIGLLAAVVLASVATARKKAGIAAALQDMEQIRTAVVAAELESGKTLMQITGSGCSRCNVTCTPGPLNGTTNACYTQWTSDLQKIAVASNGVYPNVIAYDRDPWGSPFLLDENEGETPGNPCRIDALYSAGPDATLSTSDDFSMYLPFSSAAC